MVVVCFCVYICYKISIISQGLKEAYMTIGQDKAGKMNMFGKYNPLSCIFAKNDTTMEQIQ